MKTKFAFVTLLLLLLSFSLFSQIVNPSVGIGPKITKFDADIRPITDTMRFREGKNQVYSGDKFTLYANVHKGKFTDYTAFDLKGNKLPTTLYSPKDGADKEGL